MYTPHVGRWLSKDPAGYIDGPNQYLYVSGDPINLTDPSGRQALAATSSAQVFRSKATLSALAMAQQPVGAQKKDNVPEWVKGCLAGLVAAPIGAPGILCAGWQFVYIRLSKDWGKVNDKWAHCTATCRASKVCGMVFGLSGAVFKEFLDCLGLGTPDMEDIEADTTGARCAGAETFIPIFGGLIGCAFRESCDECCEKNAKGGKWR